jgi:hypothetical protein
MWSVVIESPKIASGPRAWMSPGRGRVIDMPSK